MTMHEAVLIGQAMYANLYDEIPPDDLSAYIEDACKMVRRTCSPHEDSKNELRSTQVIAGIVVAYRMTRSEPCHD